MRTNKLLKKSIQDFFSHARPKRSFGLASFFKHLRVRKIRRERIFAQAPKGRGAGTRRAKMAVLFRCAILLRGKARGAPPCAPARPATGRACPLTAPQPAEKRIFQQAVNALFAAAWFAVGHAALAVELPQANPVPGGVAIVPLAHAAETAPRVRFGNDRVMVVRHDGRWHAVVGLPLTLATGEHRLSQDGAGAAVFAVRPKEYAAQHLTLTDKRMVDPTASDLKRIGREQKSYNAHSKPGARRLPRRCVSTCPRTGG